MSGLEQLFSSADLHVVVPESSSTEPPPSESGVSVDEWLEKISTEATERSQAFYDERLESLLLLRLDTSTSDADPKNPPKQLLDLLSRVQVSLEASYISASSSGPILPPTPNAQSPILSAPPRSKSLLAPPSAAKSARPATAVPHHPSIFPPATPNPTPFAAEQDKRYLAVEGTPLLAAFWGQDESVRAREALWLLWSEKESVWVAVYRLAMTVAFLRLNYDDPLLCLTISATLRERPLNVDRFPNHPIASFLNLYSFNSDEQADSKASTSDSAADVESSPKTTDLGDSLEGFEEVNLFEGLTYNPSFASQDMNLPSTRLGSISRQKHFLLPFVEPTTPVYPSPGPVTALKGPQQKSTIKKSYRKTLATVSGFRVRMRTVFVPAFMLPRKRRSDGEDEDDSLDGAADNERTVVLCVEVENSGEAGPEVAFQIERIEVKVQSSQEKNKKSLSSSANDIEAEARLIGWGEGFTTAEGGEEKKVFPLKIGANEQYNILYAVTFLRNPEEDLKEVFGGNAAIQADMQRAVGIEIFGRPWSDSKEQDEPQFPTPTFPSKWNCILDLSPAGQQQPPPPPRDGLESQRDVLPEPASPFPGSTLTSPRSSLPPSAAIPLSSSNRGSMFPVRKDSLPPVPRSSTVSPAPDRRNTMPTVAARAIGLKSPPLRPASSVLLQHRLSEPFQHPQQISPGGGSPRPSSILPPSVSAAINAPRSPTTYGPPSPSLSGFGPPPNMQRSDSYGFPQSYDPPSATSLTSPPPPMTPAYPSFPTDSLPQSPTVSTVPRIGGSVAGGLHTTYSSTESIPTAVEIRREKGIGMTGLFGSSSGGNASLGKVPPTPAPIISTTGGPSGEPWGSQTFFESGGNPSLATLGAGGDVGGQGNDNQVVVSVGLLEQSETRSSLSTWKGETAEVVKENENRGTKRLEPFDHFTLDIFVFNQSSRTRRLEVGCPIGSRRRRATLAARRKKGLIDNDEIGILPLENKIRVGPLLPSTCQTVRMEFMALTPGVHPIDSLTLTDTASGNVVNLRSVMDIVVHEPSVR